jgi:hypothetical protein
MSYESSCTCYKPWASILPPQRCPVHTTWNRFPLAPTYTGTLQTVTVASSLTTSCRGRHCAHGPACGTYYSQNGG